MFWEDVLVEESEENYPRPRAGHCAVGVSISTKICSVYFFVAFAAAYQHIFPLQHLVLLQCS